MSDLPRSRATAVQALIDPLIAQWRKRADEAYQLAARYDNVVDDAGNGHAFRKERRVWTTCADQLTELAALLLREGPQEMPAVRDKETGAIYRVMGERLDGVDLGVKTPDEIKVVRWVSNRLLASIFEPVNAMPLTSPAGPREGQEPDWIGKCPKCNRTVLNHGDLCSQCAGLREGQEPPDDCRDEEFMPHEFDSRTQYEPGDDRDIWCKHCEFHRDHEIHRPAPDHCENCRAELPVTTVHLCHACLPSAPRDHAGEAPATESVVAAYQRFVAAVRIPASGAGTINNVTIALAELSDALAALAASQAGTALKEFATPTCGEHGPMRMIYAQHHCDTCGSVDEVAAHWAVPPQET